MRSGLFTTMWCAVLVLADDLPQMTLNADIHQGRLCSQCGGILKVLFLSSCQGMEQWIVKAILDVYGRQLDCLNKSRIQKYPELTQCKGIMFHYDIARPHTNLITNQKFLELGRDVWPHPPYSPDLGRQTSTCFALFKTFCRV